MHFSLTKQRCLFAVFLLVAALGGLFPPGAHFPRSATGKGSTTVTNVPLSGDAVPLSSIKNFSSFADKAGPLNHELT